MDINSLAHTKWNCKYHIVFAPKYRRKVAYGLTKKHYKDETGYSKYFKYAMQKKKCRNSRGRDMPRPCAYACEDTTKFKCFKFCRVFERFERHANLKYKYGNRHFWCRGYYVDTVGKNAKKI